MLQIAGSVRSPAEGVEARGEINTLFKCVDFSLLSSWYWFLSFSVWFGRGPDFRIWPNLCLESHSVETTIKWFQFCVVVNLHFSSFHINNQLFSSHQAIFFQITGMLCKAPGGRRRTWPTKLQNIPKVSKASWPQIFYSKSKPSNNWCFC